MKGGREEGQWIGGGEGEVERRGRGQEEKKRGYEK